MDNLSIDVLDIGVSKQGMEQYMEALKIELLDSVKEKLNTEFDAIMIEINKGWQGSSRDRFEEKFRKQIGHIKNDLEDEYKDLSARLVELANFYYKQDESMLD